MLLVTRAVGPPGWAAMLELVEPDFVRGAVHAVEVPDAAVCDQALEAAGADGEPIHHVAAERRTGGAHALLVDVRQLLQVIDAFHEVVITLAAPIAADLFDVLLAKAGRAARVG